MRKKVYGPHKKAHPAVFSDPLIPVFASILNRHFGNRTSITILDPFAGVGRIHELMDVRYTTTQSFETYGLEIEPGWAECHPRTKTGDVLKITKYYRRQFDVIVTSPTFGNRFADHHNAQDASMRRSYFHDYGEPLHENNSGVLHWGPRYRLFHQRAWIRVDRLLKDGGLFVVNLKDHHNTKKGGRQHVCRWHLKVLRQIGYKRIESIEVATTGMRHGENREIRYPEMVYVLRKVGN